MKDSFDLVLLVKESLTNAYKHSKASKVAFNLESTQNKLKISVMDNGVSFDPNTIKKGMGLNGIKSRAEKIGATFSLTTSSEGTNVLIEKEI